MMSLFTRSGASAPTHSPRRLTWKSLGLLAGFSSLLLIADRPASAGTWTVTRTISSGTATATYTPNSSMRFYTTYLTNGQVLTIPSMATGVELQSMTPYGSMNASSQGSTSGAVMTFTFTWTPAAGQTLMTDPPPATVTVVVSLQRRQSYSIANSNMGAVHSIATAKISGDGVTFPDLTIDNTTQGAHVSSDTGTLTTKVIHSNLAVPMSGIVTLPVSLSGQVTASYSGFVVGSQNMALASIFPSASAIDVVLTTPDPKVFPTRGNAANKYTFDATTSILDNPAWAATVIGDIANNYLAVTTFTSFDVGSSVKTSGAKAVVGNDITQQFTYTNLPSNNGDFGNKIVKVDVGAPLNTSQSANVQVFFPKAGTNHPLPDLPIATSLFAGGVTPNWYYYWSQTSANYGTHYYGGSPAGQTGVTYFDKAGNTAFAAPKNAWVTLIYGGAGGTTAAGTWGNADGIDLFANICRHEAQHLADMPALWGNNDRNVGDDPDGDYLPTNVVDPNNPAQQIKEHDLGVPYHPTVPAGGYDPNSALTPGIVDHFSYGMGFNDGEDYAMHREAAWVNGSADGSDWANPGHQY